MGGDALIPLKSKMGRQGSACGAQQFRTSNLKSTDTLATQAVDAAQGEGRGLDKTAELDEGEAERTPLRDLILTDMPFLSSSSAQRGLAARPQLGCKGPITWKTAAGSQRYTRLAARLQLGAGLPLEDATELQLGANAGLPLMLLVCWVPADALPH
jgi:hypothetical protein